MKDITENRYKKLARRIRSDQLSTKQVMAEFKEDPEFAIWYKNKYTIKWYSYP